MAAEHLTAVRAKMHEMKALERSLIAFVKSCDTSCAGLSARNRLWGYIDEVRVDGLLAQVRLRGGDQPLTAVITADAVRALRLRRGDDAMAIVKATEVMIARSSSGRRSTTRG